MSECMNISPKGNIFPIDAMAGGIFFFLPILLCDWCILPPHPLLFSQKLSPFHYFFFVTIENKKNTPQFVSPQLILCFWQSLIWLVLRADICVVLSTMMRISVVFWWHDVLLPSTSKLRLCRSHFWLYIFLPTIMSNIISLLYNSKQLRTDFHVSSLL
jgi:hypothetical protein